MAAIYPDALPQVYGYLVPRCGSVALAEDLTAETFMAAVGGRARHPPPHVSVAWLIGIARHKLVDHWRRRSASAAASPRCEQETTPSEDPWGEFLDAQAAHVALRRLPGPSARR